MKSSTFRNASIPFAYAGLALCVAACDRSTSAAEPPPETARSAVTHSATPAEQGAKPMDGAKPAEASAAQPAQPPPMVLAQTADDKLGTAPPGLGLTVGSAAPNVTLDSISGGPVSLGSLYAKKPTYVIFYRGGWCPFCNMQIHELSKAAPEFEKRGIQLVAISVDKPTEEAKTQAKHGVPFTILSDPKMKALHAFHVVHTAGVDEQKVLTGFGIDLDAYSGESHKSFSVPSIFLVDRRGIVRFQHVDEDFKTRPSVSQMLAVADRTFPPAGMRTSANDSAR
jgi:peroxiredoxin